jgi:hypothetical protein
LSLAKLIFSNTVAGGHHHIEHAAVSQSFIPNLAEWQHMHKSFNCQWNHIGHGIENVLVLHTYIHKQELTAGPSSMDLTLSLLDVVFSFHLNVAPETEETNLIIILHKAIK